MTLKRFTSPCPSESTGFPTLEELAVRMFGEYGAKEALACPALAAFLRRRLDNGASRMSEHQERVADFMQLAGQELPSTPGVPSGKIRELRVRLLLEEVMEYAEAAGVAVGVTIRTDEATTWTAAVEFKDMLVKAKEDAKPDLVKMVDAHGDISVVNVGGLLALGVGDVAVLEEVDHSNLQKFGPGGHKDENGKWRKPPDHKPPDLVNVLTAQGWQPTEVTSHDGRQDLQLPG